MEEEPREEPRRESLPQLPRLRRCSEGKATHFRGGHRQGARWRQLRHRLTEGHQPGSQSGSPDKKSNGRQKVQACSMEQLGHGAQEDLRQGAWPIPNCSDPARAGDGRGPRRAGVRKIEPEESGCQHGSGCRPECTGDHGCRGGVRGHHARWLRIGGSPGVQRGPPPKHTAAGRCEKGSCRHRDLTARSCYYPSTAQEPSLQPGSQHAAADESRAAPEKHAAVEDRDGLCITWTDPSLELADPERLPVLLSLAETIPCTDFQDAVQDLRNLLLVRCSIEPIAWQDWLNCDLQFVHAECKACPAIWDWLCSCASWYDDPFIPEAVHLYTDGSANQNCSRGSAPAAWTFNAWALVGTKQAYLGHALGVTTQEHSPFFLGEVCDDALTGEQLALAWALSWAIEASCAFQTASFIFHFDNVAAGHGGFGSFRLPRDAQTSQPTALSHSLAVLRQCAQAVCTVIGRHVPSHAGFAGNELADVLAKFASLVVRHRLSEWAWLALRDQDDLPALGAFEAEARRLFVAAAARTYTFFAEEHSQPIGHGLTEGTLGVQLRACTLNVLSLREWDDLPQGLAVVGKRALLKQQFLGKQLHVVALQETRTPGDCVQPDGDFVMLHSSCDSQGCFGCAIWLSKTLPFAVAGQRVCYLSKEDCTVVHAEPRLLIAQVDLPDFPVTYVSAHAPYDGHRSHCAEDFWCKVGLVAARRPSGSQLVVLTDSNGHLGSVNSNAVGTAGAEHENQAGTAFHAFLTDFGLCLPATFSDLHSGCHWTWKAGSLSGHRLDYIAVPNDWLTGELASTVWYDFDDVHDVDDHQPVLLFCELKGTMPPFKAPRPRPDTDPGQLQCFQFAIEALPKIDWNVDVDLHYSSFAHSTIWSWSEFVKPTPIARCKPFVSEETLATIHHRKQVRDFLASETHMLERARKLAGLFAFWLEWRQAVPDDAQVQFLASLFKRGRLNVASAVGCLGRLRLFLRKAIQRDRAAYLSRLAGEVAETSLQNPKQLFAAVYKAFPVVKSKRRGGFCPLPAVLLEDGSRAKDVTERMQRWTEHFAKQEGGQIVAAAGYDQAVKAQMADPAGVPLFDIRCVPTLLDVEQDILQLRNGKAAGPDLITADILKINVPSSSRRLLPIFAKAALSCREPIVFKGGCLITLAKKAFASLNCADFRSIILSSVPGKLLHRSLRKRLLPPLQEVVLPLQAGALPGASPELLTLYLTAFQRWAQTNQCRWAVAFFDVKQAYYRTLRQLVVDCDSDAGLQKVLYDLGLPPPATCELRDLLQKAAATSPLAGHQHLTALLRDLLSATWFKFEASQLVAVTHKGTRPGDPAADVLLAFTLSALFRGIDTCLSDHGLIDALPPVQHEPLVGGYASPEHLQFVSWADDFARPFVGGSPLELVDKVRRATKCCTERASACGIELSFGKDKTAAVCDIETVQALQTDGTDLCTAGIAFSDEVANKPCVLPVVHAYKHLGGIFSASAKPDLELFLRKALAIGPLKSVRSKLFANRAVPLATRRTLLYALGLSRFIHGAGALHLNQKGHLRAWNSIYISLWAHLVPSVPGSQFPGAVCLQGSATTFVFGLAEGQPPCQADLQRLCDDISHAAA